MASEDLIAPPLVSGDALIQIAPKICAPFTMVILQNAHPRDSRVRSAIEEGMAWEVPLHYPNKWDARSQFQGWATATKHFNAKGENVNQLEYPDDIAIDGDTGVYVRDFKPEEVMVPHGTVEQQSGFLLAELQKRSENPFEFFINARLTEEGRAIGARSSIRAGRYVRDKDGRRVEALAPQQVRIVVVDIDAIEVPTHIDPTTELAVQWALDSYFPQPFPDARCVYQFSSSAGMRGQVLKVHLWFITEEPIDLGQAKSWANNLNNQHGFRVIDPQPFSNWQNIYYGNPGFDVPSMDPFRGRSRWGIRGHRSLNARAFDFVPVITSSHMLAMSQLPVPENKILFGEPLEIAAKMDDATVGVHQPLRRAVTVLVMLYGEKAFDMADSFVESLTQIYENAVATGRVKPRSYVDSEIARVRDNIQNLLDKGFGLRAVPGGYSKNLKRLRKGEELTLDGVTYTSRDFAWSVMVSGIKTKSPETLKAIIQQVLISTSREDIDAQLLVEKAQEILEERCQQALSHRGFNRYGINVNSIDTLDQVPVGQPGLMVVRAQQGTGKTEKTGKAIAKTADFPVHISPRVALTADASTRLGMKNYQSDMPAWPFERGLATCLPSLANERVWKQISDAIDSGKRISVILDEVTALFDMLADPKLHKSRTVQRNFERFNSLLQNAHQIVALDADVGDAEIDVLLQLSDRYVHIYQMLEDLSDLTFREENFSNFSQNPPAGRTLVMTDSINLSNLVPWMDTGKGQAGEALNILFVNSETRDTDGVKRFVADPNDFLTKNDYDVVVATPTIDTGLSITAPVFENVIGVFYGVVAPETMLQMLRRYRPARDFTIVRRNAGVHHQVYAAVLRHGLQRLLGKDASLEPTLDSYTEFAIARKENIEARRALGVPGLFDILTNAGARVEAAALDEEDPAWLKALSARSKEKKRAHAQDVVDARDVAAERVDQLLSKPGDNEARQKFFVKRALGLDTADSRAITAEDVLWVDKYGDSAVGLLADVLWMQGPSDNDRFMESIDSTPAAARNHARRRAELVRGGLGALGLEPTTMSGRIDQEKAAAFLAYLGEHWTEFEAAKLMRIPHREREGEFRVEAGPKNIGSLLRKFMQAIGLTLTDNGAKGAWRAWEVEKKGFAYVLEAVARRRGMRLSDISVDTRDWSAWTRKKRGRQARDWMNNGILPLAARWLVAKGVAEKRVADWRRSVLKELPEFLSERIIGRERVIADRSLTDAEVEARLSATIAKA